MRKLLFLVISLTMMNVYSQDFNEICKSVALTTITPPSFTCCYYGSPVTFSRMDIGQSTKNIGGLTKFLDVVSVSKGEIFPLRVFISPPSSAPIYAMRVWIDINKNDVFDENSEQFYSSKQCEAEKSNFQAFIILPKEITGYFLMRIVVEDGADWCQFSKDPPHATGQLGEGVYSDILLNIK